ncbi:MAG TPA: DegT/DnrJ/EryC1/StrS family aminotransferase [Abditibacteriaceae bacterium]|nr:DegT/DnrJ/EryC1/StrS family aminotransferase [Abditibacteriaceae bacterium]
MTAEPLALLGGPKAVAHEEPELFHWPIVTEEDEAAVIDVMRTARFSGTDITKQFEAEWSAYQGVQYSLGHPSGTASLLAAMYGAGIGRGDEMIVPSLTFWASALQTYDLGATPVFADIDPDSVCIDPDDIEHRITPRTKAIMVVHYCGHPCDMDPILEIARRRGIKVIEDVSHAQGTLYKGRMVGSIGDVAGLSMMGGKSFAIGEAGMLCTNDREIYERAIAFGHYEKGGELTRPELKRYAGLPLGGYKFRLNQTCSAMGRVQLKYYPQRIQEIQDAMNRFWDLLEGVPGLRAHRPADEGSTMGGWYNPLGHYVPEELGGLPVEKFIEAVNAEGGLTGRGCNFPLHLHPVLNEADVYNDGKPTRIAFAERDVREPSGSLPVTEALAAHCLGVPWFKHDWPESIERYAAAFRKVALQADELLEQVA